ncbi:MAG: hypothetical protein P8O76_03665 [Methylophilaceae bacterium]|nr:hypothetical protein [Methylophilaceae bacterium]MDG1820238.1 hypothetical protein [Methylophilaceae bacterium]
MNDLQNYGAEQEPVPAKTNNYVRFGFMAVFIIAVAILPTVATVKFFLV